MQNTLYNPAIVGRTQPITRPHYWVAIESRDGKSVTVLEVSATKDNIEIVGWHKLDKKGLEKLKKQAEREDGQLLIQTSDEAAAALSTLPPGLQGKDSEDLANAQAAAEALQARSDAFDRLSKAAFDDKAFEAAHEALTEAQDAFAASLSKVSDEALRQLARQYAANTEAGSLVSEELARRQAAEGGQGSAGRDAAEFPYTTARGTRYRAAAIRTDGEGQRYVVQYEGETDAATGESRERRLTVKNAPAEATMAVFSPNGVIPMGYAARDAETGKWTVWGMDGKEVKTPAAPREQRAAEAAAPLTPREAALRDALTETLRRAGLDVSTDEKVGQDVLDRANAEGVRLGTKKASETGRLASNETPPQGPAISDADAKVRQNLQRLAKGYEERGKTDTRTFVGTLAEALGLPADAFKGKNSRYVTIEAKNGATVTLRLSNHNADVRNFDNRGEREGVSIVISRHSNKGIKGDGNAHIVEYFYPDKVLSKADGHPLSDIVRGVEQMLYSGEYKDTTGLAERQEVNEPAGRIRFERAYHGSGVDFDKFHTLEHLSEGEGGQAFGVGTYVADQKGLAEKYAEIAKREEQLVNIDGEWVPFNSTEHPLQPGVLRAINGVYRDGRAHAIRNIESVIKRQVKLGFGDSTVVKECQEALDFINSHEITFPGKPKYRYSRLLYTVEIPDDTGHNYLDWDAAITTKQAADIADALYKEVLANDEDGMYASPEARKALREEIGQIMPYYRVVGSTSTKIAPDVGDVYGTISSYLGSQKAASEFLHRLGYTGIKVHAAHNSGDERYRQNWNYVIFNDGDVQIQDKVRFFRTADGKEAYGFTVGGKIYLDPRIATAETPLHEYAHLWGEMLRRVNPEGWADVVRLMQGERALWADVRRRYPELSEDADALAEEVLAHYSGRRGAARLRAEQERILRGEGEPTEKAAAVSALQKVKAALQKFWHAVADLLHIRFTRAEDVADRVMADMLQGVDPRKVGAEQAEAEREAAAIAERARADGMYMQAPNGRPTRLTERQWAGVRTTGFKRWFGDWEHDAEHASKVVDENGEPLVVYHGSRKGGFSVFDDSEGEKQSNAPAGSSFFTSSRDVAYTYSGSSEKPHYEREKDEWGDADEADYPSVYACFLNIRSPHYEDFEGADWQGDAYGKYEIYNGETGETVYTPQGKRFFDSREEAEDYAKSLGLEDYDIKEDPYLGLSVNDVVREAMEIGGADGVIIRNVYDNGSHGVGDVATDYIAFHPEQIKSATDNVGTFSSENPDIRYQFLGEQGAGRLDEAEERTERLDALSVARKMEEAGRDAAAVKLATGWERGADGKWRYEVPDAKVDMSQFDYRNDAEVYTRRRRLDTVLVGKGAEALFNAYPELRKVKVQSPHGDAMPGLSGDYNGKTLIRVSGSLFTKPEEMRRTLLHEVQHAIQGIEGFARGGSPQLMRKRAVEINRRKKEDTATRQRLSEVDSQIKDIINGLKKEHPYDASRNLHYRAEQMPEYRRLVEERGKLRGQLKEVTPLELYSRLGGEVEARNVQKRLGMSAEERRRTLAAETEDVAREDQIFLRGEGGASESRAEEKRREEEELREVNERFNEGLAGFTEKNAQGKVLSLGSPGAKLLSTGIADKEMKLYGSKLLAKARKHGFSFSDVKDLPLAVSDPIAIFKGSVDGSHAILTEMRIGDKNVLVTLSVGKDNDVDFNIVSSIYGKNGKGVIDWINTGRLLYADKEKALDYLRISAPIAEAQDSQELSSAAKVVKEFENPALPGGEKIGRGKNLSDRGATDLYREGDADGSVEAAKAEAAAPVAKRSAAEHLSGQLHTPLRIVEDVSEITHADAKVQRRRRGAKGWYDTRTGEVVIVLPNNADAADVASTVMHETVAHKGLRELVGEERYGEFLDGVHDHLTDDLKKEVDERANRAFLHDVEDNGGAARSRAEHVRRETDELLGRLAEKGFEDFTEGERTVWQRLKAAVRRVIDKFLGSLKLPKRFQFGDNELRYMLWRSKERLERGREDAIDRARDIAKRRELGLDEADTAMYRDPGADVARDSYNERTTGSTTHNYREAFQDSMLSVKKLQEALEKETGVEVKDYENVYVQENSMSSRNKEQMDRYKKRHMKPVMKAEAALRKAGASGEEVRRYMIAKHGLERNAVMAKRDAELAYDKYRQAHPGGAQTLQDFEAAYRGRDYAGLTGLTGEADVAAAESAARGLVDAFEADYDTSALWSAVNAATKETLRTAYEGGLMDEATYDKVRNMYEYYVPLRGWEETTSDEVYDYLTSSARSGRGGNSTLMRASGRSSVADDPIATIGQMAQVAIIQANRNLLKQSFLVLALNHPTSLLSVNKLWMRYDDVSGEWEPMLPDFSRLSPEATGAEVAATVSTFNARMEQLAQQAPDRYREKRQADNIPFRLKPGQLNEHQVLVRAAGKVYVITVNGNPRAAQAINGLTNPNGTDNVVLQTVQSLNRFMASNYTARNPNFVLSNLVRDFYFAGNMAFVKEGWEYAARGAVNYAKAIVALPFLIRRYERGTLRDTGIEGLFKEFMQGGGETGYTFLRSVDDYKKIVEDYVKNERRSWLNPKKALRALASGLELFSRWAEDTARFTAYMTSREMGRSVVRSIYDAKEISVNFNKKGAGMATYGEHNRLAPSLAELCRDAYIFWNPGVQGLDNVARASKAHPGRAAIAVGVNLAAGLLIPFVNKIIASALGFGGDDDEKKEGGEENKGMEEYYKLPEWTRRSNICLWTGSGWITIPLSPEIRAVYGIGELTSSLLSGHEDATDTVAVARKYAAQLTATLPIDLLEGNDGWLNLVPTYARPLVENAMNEDWTGKPIYKETPWNEHEPGYQKAYRNTNGLLVSASERLNSLTGGNAHRSGAVDINPAKVEHILEGYLGGVASFTNQVMKTTASAFGKQDFDVRNVPIANRFYKNSGTEQNQDRLMESNYYQRADELEAVGNEYQGFRRDATDPSRTEEQRAEALKQMQNVMRDKRFWEWLVMQRSSRHLSKLRKQRAAEAAAPLTLREAALRDALTETLRRAGLDVSTDEKEGQAVLDRANAEGVRLGTKKASETGRLASNETPPQGPAISDADAKVRQNLQRLAKGYDVLDRELTHRICFFLLLAIVLFAYFCALYHKTKMQ